MQSFTARQRTGLLIVALFGFLVPNGLFVYVALRQPELLKDALANPIGQTLMGEAFLLTGLFAWLIHRFRPRGAGWLGFVALSLIGSLAFSVPFSLYLASRGDPTKP